MGLAASLGRVLGGGGAAPGQAGCSLPLCSPAVWCAVARNGRASGHQRGSCCWSCPHAVRASPGGRGGEERRVCRDREGLSVWVDRAAHCRRMPVAKPIPSRAGPARGLSSWADIHSARQFQPIPSTLPPPPVTTEAGRAWEQVEFRNWQMPSPPKSGPMSVLQSWRPGVCENRVPALMSSGCPRGPRSPGSSLEHSGQAEHPGYPLPLPGRSTPCL